MFQLLPRQQPIPCGIPHYKGSNYYCKRPSDAGQTQKWKAHTHSQTDNLVPVKFLFTLSDVAVTFNINHGHWNRYASAKFHGSYDTAKFERSCFKSLWERKITRSFLMHKSSPFNTWKTHERPSCARLHPWIWEAKITIKSFFHAQNISLKYIENTWKAIMCKSSSMILTIKPTLNLII